MTDMRNPLTMEFHKARRRADLLRPENANDLDGDREAQLEYRDAVHDYVTAFDVAEAEAIRLRRSGFSDEDQQRIARAQNLLRLAEDDAATPQERQSAYARARPNSTASWPCPPPPGPASSAGSPERSRRSFSGRAGIGYLAGENIVEIYAAFERYKWYVIAAIVVVAAILITRRSGADAPAPALSTF